MEKNVDKKVAFEIKEPRMNIKSNIAQFQKITASTPRIVIGNSDGEGVSIAKTLEEKYSMKLNWNFQVGGLRV